MKLITEVDLPDYPFRLDHRSSMLMMGSCFTENIGQLLTKYLFPICINPFGITYNPLSVKKGLEALINKESYEAADLDMYQDLWLSFAHDTGFSSPAPEKTLEKINQAFQEGKKILRKADFLFITWGTSWVFRSKNSGEVVNNCHKLPAAEFTRYRLSTQKIIQAYEDLLPGLFQFNPNLKIIQTISPVRHWKDGAHGNQLSKASLLLAGEALQKTYPDRFFYFPSYELVMDELRDYRFYASDLLHVSDQATRYIWEKFDRALLNENAKKTISDLDSYLKMLEHRPMNTGGAAHENMLESKEKRHQELREKYPDLNWKLLDHD